MHDSSPHLPFLHRTLELAGRARGRTSPNPTVGAVVVAADGRVLGEGFHEKAGAPHAEVVALRAAGDSARGATLYISLEPCDHTGRTPPCTAAILEAGVARVVTALEDPDPRVRGRGHDRLRAAGLEVLAGLLPEEASAAIAEYIHRVSTGRAFVAMKAAVTLDGRLGADGGDSRWITGEAARLRAHELRDRYDALLVGRGTLERDDPRLDVRNVPGGRDPVVVVLDSRLTAPSSRVLWDRAKAGARVLVATTAAAAASRAAALRDTGVEVLTIASTAAGAVDLASLFELLATRGLNSVLVEGGERVHTSILAAGLVSRAHIFLAPSILGGASGPRLVGDLGIRRAADALRLVNPSIERLGDDLLVSGEIPASPEVADVHRHHS